MTDYTVETVDSSFSYNNNKRARLAQSVEHQTFNLRVMGSSPISGEWNFCFCFWEVKKNDSHFINYTAQANRRPAHFKSFIFTGSW